MQSDKPSEDPDVSTDLLTIKPKINLEPKINTDMNNTAQESIKYRLIDDIGLLTQTADLLHPNDILNCLLVKNKLRPAYMIQTVDTYRKQRNVTKDVHNICKYFGFTIRSMYQGIIVSQDDVPEDVDHDHEKLGMCLGYPCYKDLKYHIDKKNYKTTQTTFSCILSVKITRIPIEKPKVNDVVQMDETPDDGFDRKDFKDSDPAPITCVSIPDVDVDIMANITLESNVQKFYNDTKNIMHYFQLLNSALKKDPRASSIGLEPRIDLRILYCIKERIGKYILYFLQGDMAVGGPRGMCSIRDDVYDIFDNFEYNLIHRLCTRYNLDIFDPKMYDLVYGALYYSVCEAEYYPMAITSRADKIQFIKACIQQDNLLSQDQLVNIEDDIDEAYKDR